MHITRWESYEKLERAAGDWSGEGPASGPAHRSEAAWGLRRCTDHSHNFTRAWATWPRAACRPPPARPSPGAQGQSAGPSLTQSTQGIPGGVQTDAQRLQGESHETARRKGGGVKQTLKLALRKQRRGPEARRWRPLPGRPPRAFPGSLYPPLLKPAFGPRPGARPTRQEWRAPCWKQDLGTRVASRDLGVYRSSPNCGRKMLRSLRIENLRILVVELKIWLTGLQWALSFPEFSFKSVSLLQHTSNGIRVMGREGVEVSGI